MTIKREYATSRRSDFNMDFIKSINKLNAIIGNGIEIKPVPHFRVEILSRGKGSYKSAVGYAAYCAGTRLRNELDGRIYDKWSERDDIFFSRIMLPKNAPHSYKDREILWNEVEKIEKNKNAQLARTLVIALPKEFSTDTQKRIICQYVQETFVNRGMCADINLHDKGVGNPHAHVILTMRSIDENGNWMAKQRKVYQLDENGNKIYDRIKKQYKCTTQKCNNWDDLCNVEQWREKWADICNKEFERLGLSKRITHESYQRQGVGIIPTKHLGSVVTALERKGMRTKAGEKNRDIHLKNVKLIIDMAYKAFRKIMDKMRKMLQQVKQQLAQERPEQKLTICEELSLSLYNNNEKTKIPQSTRGYRQYQRKYTRTHSRDFVPSL